MALPSHAVHGALGVPADLTQYATRTLDFLNVIEKTLRSVTSEVDLIQTIAVGVRRHIDGIRAAKGDALLDPSGRASELLVKAAAAANRSYVESVGYRDSAREDPDLHEDDGVVECFSDLVAAFADVHNAIEDLREAVEIHDAQRSPVVGTYSNVEDLIASLKG